MDTQTPNTEPHSPEPWYAITQEDESVIVRHADGNTVLSDPYTYSAEDAQRIVACVNFCAGFSTDFLEKNQLAPTDQPDPDLPDYTPVPHAYAVERKS